MPASAKTKFIHTAAVIKFFVVNLFFRLYLLAFSFERFRQKAATQSLEIAPSWISRRIGWYTFYTSRFVPGSTCLSRAMTAQYALKRRGYSSQIKAGVAIDPKDNSSVLAHAWLISGTEIVVGNEDGEVGRFREILNTSTSHR
jgi:hypothetical protein